MSEFTQEDINDFMRELADDARCDIMPKMRVSKFCMVCLAPEAEDIYLALQIGIALLFDKPLIIIATDNVWIAPRLRALADVVVEGDIKTEEMKERVRLGIGELMRKRGLQ